MRSSQKTLTPAVCFWVLLAACSADNAVREPKEMVDLGAFVTEDLAERVWGKAALASLNFTRRNAFDVIEWEFETVGGTVTGSNAYYTLFTRAAPVHHAFLSRGIPVYEQLFNVDRLVGKAEMYFVGVPLNIREGDGMLVRPVVFVC